MSAKEIALALLKLAVGALPELGRLLGNALAGSDEPLAEEVRRILPEESASARAARELAGR